MNQVVLRPHPTEPADTWVRDFEVLISADSPETGFTRVTSGQLAGKVDTGTARVTPTITLAPPGFGLPSDGGPGLRLAFPEATAQYVMLRVLTNYGSTSYTSLGEFEVYWTAPGASGASGAAGTPTGSISTSR